MQKEMKSIKDKRAAMELSIGTIVVVVLAMAMLILGLVLIKSIFKGTTNVADMTIKELENQISVLFGADKKLAVYPDSRQVDIKQDSVNGFGFGIKNMLQGVATGTKFSYEIVVSDSDIRTKCGISEADALKWITTGRSESNINIVSGDLAVAKVLFSVPTGSPLCTVRFRINVKANSQDYATDFMDVTLKSK